MALHVRYGKLLSSPANPSLTMITKVRRNLHLEALFAQHTRAGGAVFILSLSRHCHSPSNNKKLRRVWNRQ